MNSLEGKIVSIYICPKAGAPMEEVSSVMALAGGLENDRYFLHLGAYSKSNPPKIRDISIISAEKLEDANKMFGCNFLPVWTRRNLLVRNIDVDIIPEGAVVEAGSVRIRITKYCEPCDRPSKLIGEKQPGFKALMDAVHGGGLRGEIILDGEIKQNDRIVVLDVTTTPNS